MKFFTFIILLFLTLGLNAQTFYHFDGVDDFVSVNRVGNGILNNYSSPHDFTIEIRFRYHATPSGRQLVSKQSTPSDGFFLEFPNGTTNLKAGMGWYHSLTSSSNYETVTSGSLTINTWYTAALVYNQAANSFQFYIDGTLIGSNTLPYPYAPEVDYAIAIGKSLAWGGVSPIDVDFFRIWNNQQSQVQLDANEDLEVAGSASNLMLQYTFNHTADPIAVEDTSPNNNDAVASGAVSYSPRANLSTSSPSSVAEGTACAGTSDITFDVSLDAEPTANTIVALSTSGTAILGTDYSISTSSVTFTPLDWNTPQTVTLSVVRDAVIEEDETIIVDISGGVSGSNAIAGSNDNLSITIMNDESSLNIAGSTPSIIMEEDFESGMGGFTSTAVQDGEFMVGDNAAATSSFYIIGTSNTSNFAYLNEDVCNCSMVDVKLISPVIDLSNVTDAYMTFDHAFADGNSTLEKLDVVVSTNGGSSWSSSILNINNPNSTNDSGRITAPWVYGINIPLSAYDGESNFKIAFVYRDGGAWMYGTAIDNIKIWGKNEVAVPAQTAVNTSSGYAEHNLGAGEIVHFFDQNTGEIMCSIDNSNSSHDYGCTRVEIDRAGTGAMEFASPNTGSYMFSKSLKITPTTNTTSDANGYTITLYYSDTEMTGWENATGESRNNVKLQKVDGNNHISDVTSGNPSGLSITSANTSYAAFGDNHSFSATFTNGFSGFGAGVPGSTLPVELMLFEARKDNRNTLLNWVTASEENNMGFHMEKSANGKDFERIAWISGNGNTAEIHEYQFVDEKPYSGINYYRLAQEDFDGTIHFSKVITIVFDAVGITELFPNPSKEGERSRMIFTSLEEQTLQVVITDMRGQTVWQNKRAVETGNNVISLPSDNIAKGAYLINIYHQAGAETLKWIILE